MLDSAFVSQIVLPHPILWAVAAALCLALLIWRVWTFIIIPALRPDEPKLLPYWIPFLGHTWAFFRNPEKLINNGFHYFGSNKPFALTVAGKRTVILRNVQDVASVWRNTQALTIDGFVVEALGAFGITKPTLKKIFTDPRDLIKDDESQARSLLIRENPQKKGYMDWERDFFTAQLLEPDRLRKLLDKYLSHLQEVLAWDNLSPSYVVPRSSSEPPRDKSTTVSLQVFCRYTVSYCSTVTFFGPKLQQVAPQFLQDYQDFERLSWKVFYRLPAFLARSSHAAKEKAIDGLEKYLSLGEEERPELETIFQAINNELTHLGVGRRDVAAFIVVIIWAINNNAHKVAFWIFAHMLHDPAYLNAVCREIDGAYATPDAEPDMNVLLTACPHLDAIWYETMRVYNATSAIRHAKTDCIIGDKRIRVGDQIVAPFRQFHLNREIFGADAGSFRPERFLENKGLHRAKGYSPFGGGYTYCPGRLFAQREIYLFVAETLRRFDLELVPRPGGPRMPQVDERIPSPAAMGPDEDVLVRLTPRAH
ncbi:cytochrome P450 [Triangularia verruculosa]|uniref:Cytochrome P450 n=1 Tax=Triangularia verruculosa TaxID=2587418 RepID=A0AAN6XME4_9PEZI|nr:cytochrome P450 [Triangularia verruculosa]